MTTFEVVRSGIDGWDVRRVGERLALSNFPTRGLAEQAARIENEHEGGPSGVEAVDVHRDLVSETPDEDLPIRRTLLTVAAIAGFMIVLIGVVALVVSQTGFTG